MAFPLLQRGNFPTPPDNTGTLFNDGVRVGPSWLTDKEATPITLPGAALGQQTTEFLTWGGGVLTSPNVTYRIGPYAGTNGDIATIPQNSTSGNFSLSSTGLPNQGAAWPAICAGGEQGLQLDWPRAVSAYVTYVAGAGMGAGSSVHVYGYDFYGKPMQIKMESLTTSLIVSETNAFIPFPEELLPAGNYVFGGETTNKAFYQITRVKFTGTVPNGSFITIQTAPVFGLPFVYDEHRSMVTGINWVGLSELGVNIPASASFAAFPVQIPAASYNLEVVNPGMIIPADKNVLTSNLTGDVRGTYTPSSWPADDSGNILIFQYYVYGADMQIEQYNQMGLPQVGTPDNQVPQLKFRDLYGVPQYFTGLPA